MIYMAESKIASTNRLIHIILMHRNFNLEKYLESALVHLFFFFSFLFFSSSSFFFFFLFRAKVYGSSQARGGIGAAAVGLHHSHSNAGSNPCLWPTPQFTAMLDLNPVSEVRDQTCILMDISQVCYHWATMGSPENIRIQFFYRQSNFSSTTY